MVAGIVCEYNPFHKGHLYQLEETKKAGATDSITLTGGCAKNDGLKKAIEKSFTLFPVTEEEREKAFAPQRITAEKRGEKEWIEIENAVGRVAASAFGLFPPCLPLACDGQQIDEQTIARLRGAKHTFGVKDGKVAVYTKGEK